MKNKNDPIEQIKAECSVGMKPYRNEIGLDVCRNVDEFNELFIMYTFL